MLDEYRQCNLISTLKLSSATITKYENENIVRHSELP
jgi:hypothetical protein